MNRSSPAIIPKLDEPVDAVQVMAEFLDHLSREAETEEEGQLCFDTAQECRLATNPRHSSESDQQNPHQNSCLLWRRSVAVQAAHGVAQSEVSP